MNTEIIEIEIEKVNVEDTTNRLEAYLKMIDMTKEKTQSIENSK